MQLHDAERVARYEAAGLWGAPTWPELLATRVAAAPDELAVVDPPDLVELAGREPARLTWSDVQSRSEAMAAALAEAGVGVDDVVGEGHRLVATLVGAAGDLDQVGGVVEGGGDDELHGPATVSRRPFPYPRIP